MADEGHGRECRRERIEGWYARVQDGFGVDGRLFAVGREGGSHGLER